MHMKKKHDLQNEGHFHWRNFDSIEKWQFLNKNLNGSVMLIY